MVEHIFITFSTTPFQKSTIVYTLKEEIIILKDEKSQEQMF